MSDADIVVCEGFKMSAIPKIEVFRVAAHAEPLFGDAERHRGELLAVVTDVASLDAPARVLQFSSPSWLPELTSLVEQRVMARGA
jgi:molybdopterin-guanine dinucleotide biosynthesis protein